MPGYPLLVLPEPASVGRSNKHGGPSRVHFPSPERQVERLGPRFQTLEDAFEARRARLTQTVEGIGPEQVLVLETVGTVQEFMRAVRRVDGLEWLGEWDEYAIPPDEHFYMREPDGRDLRGRIYLVMTNQEGMRQLRSLWDRFEANPSSPEFEYGKKKFKTMFQQLRDIRPWGPEDRIRETGLMEDWAERAEAGEERTRLEVELWYRNEQVERDQAAAHVRTLIEEEGGTVRGQSVIEPIAYHALLAEMPVDRVEVVVRAGRSRVVHADQVMFLRPTGQARVENPEEILLEGYAFGDEKPLPEGDPVVAVLDGLPIENHLSLADRLIVDDPDEWASDYPVSERIHGTAICSVVAHGDLNGTSESLTRPIYLRPIMRPSTSDFRRPRTEEVPDSELPVDLVHRAVRRMMEGVGDTDGAAPTVRIVNLSVCDGSRQFDLSMSPWARLIDYLSWKYNILFVVSAGNHSQPIEVDVAPDRVPALTEDRDEAGQAVLSAIREQAWNRRIRPPGESINAVTVGALHSDESDHEGFDRVLDPFDGGSLPSPVTALGPGFRRSIKPDIFVAGGRQLLRGRPIQPGPRAILDPVANTSPPGIRAAAPGGTTGQLGRTAHFTGTSFAAAQASHYAGKLHRLTEELAGEPNGHSISPGAAPLLKALLVHGAEWGQADQLIEEYLGRIDRDEIGRLLGYGQVEFGDVPTCDDHRVTVVGMGEIGAEQGHIFSLPLPPSLSGQAVWRRLTVTLAWLTPVNPQHQSYRRAHVWFTPYGEDREDHGAERLLAVSRTGPDWQAVRRGTVQHEMFEGDRASPYVDGDNVRLKVNCTDDAGRFDGTIPYGLVATLEVASRTGIQIYEEVRARIPARVRVEAR